MKILSPTTITRHGIGLPHITLGTEGFLTISIEMFDLLELSDRRGFVFIEDKGKFFVAGREGPDVFKATKYPQKYNYVHNSSTLAFWLREKFGYQKIVMVVDGKATVRGDLKCWPLSVKEGTKRRGQNKTYDLLQKNAPTDL